MGNARLGRGGGTNNGMTGLNMLFHCQALKTAIVGRIPRNPLSSALKSGLAWHDANEAVFQLIFQLSRGQAYFG